MMDLQHPDITAAERWGYPRREEEPEAVELDPWMVCDYCLSIRPETERRCFLDYLRSNIMTRGESFDELIMGYLDGEGVREDMEAYYSDG